MHRSLRILAGSVVVLLLAAGAVNAGKPIAGTPAGLGYSTRIIDPVTLAAGGGTALITELNLPVDGSFVVNATVEVTNTSSSPIYVTCSLRHGLLGGGSALDIAETQSAPGDPTVGYGATKLALTGAVTRAAAPAGVTVHVECSSLQGAVANYSSLDAISVSSISFQ